MSIHEAAETFGISQSTLGDKLRGKSAPVATVKEKDPMLSKAVEDHKKNFQTYVCFICLIAAVQASIILNVNTKK